ncbi:hypothetical protein SNEBB_001630 [Seison nebaliae]|nr:hypothetical protein SNEBB_001630 [Seison nebaliae]
MKRIKTSKSSHKNWNTIGEGKEENNQKLSDELDENQYFACDIMVEEIRNKMNSKNFNSILFKDHVGEYHQIDVSKKECLVKNVIIKFHKDHILDQLIERENENDQKLKFHIRLDSIDLTNDHDIESIYNLNDKFSSYVLIDLHLLRRYGQTLNGWYNIENSSGDVIGLLKVLIQPTSSFSKLEKIRESTKTYIPLNNPTNTFTNISRQQLFNSSTSIPQSTVSIPPISPDKSNPYMMKLNETLSNLERLKFRFNDIMSSTAANMSTTTTTKTMAVSSNTNTSLHITPSIDNNQMNNSEVTILPQTEKEENKCSKGIQTINSPSKSHETTETFSANRQLYEFHDETAIRSSFDTNMPSTMLNDNNSEVLNELMENGVNNDIPFNPSLDKRTTNSPAESISITDDVDDDESVNTVTITENPIDDDNEIDEDDNIEINENEIMSTLQRMEDKLRRDKFKSSPTKQSKEKIHLLQMFNDISGKFVKEKKSLDENKIQHNVKLERFKSHFTPDELKRIDAIFQKQNKKT